MFLLLLFVNFESHLSKHVNCTSIKVVQENLYTCYFKTPNTCLIEAASHIVVHDSDRIGPIQLKFTFLEIPPKVQGQTHSNLHFFRQIARSFDGLNFQTADLIELKFSGYLSFMF